MWHMRSQLCAVFNCTDLQLETKGILAQFRAWLESHPELTPNFDPLYADPVNVDIALKFFGFYTCEIKNHEMV